MKRALRIVIVASAVLSLCGCGVVYQSRENQILRNASETGYGPQPLANYQDTEKDIILRSLRDPESARFNFVALRGSAIQSHFLGMEPILVWVSEVQVNAKNGYGGYTGFQPYYFAWHNGELVATGSARDYPSGIRPIGPIRPREADIDWSYVK